ncbi:hypothetical protein QEZ48_09285 [Aquamicrobium lusatiense]|uniref:hypothetical protein n=1 Tax=Aquamicrobium lusatiense TaxID=89772 RepID=UPI00245573EB|nr:hypothetical protein [Aquamicrobium lusatiense]MDH4991022.1 hypothetical protein [Aquamicrobium lusatiense]
MVACGLSPLAAGLGRYPTGIGRCVSPTKRQISGWRMRQRDALKILYVAIVLVTLAVGATGVYGLYDHLQSMKEFNARLKIDSDEIR